MPTSAEIQAFNEVYNSKNFEVDYKVVIDGTEYGSDQIWSIKTSRSLFTQNTPTIGCAVIGQIDLTILNPGVTFARTASIKPYIRLIGANGTTTAWFQKGEFFIDTRSLDNSDENELLDIQGYDIMRRANVLYPSSKLEWSATSPTTFNCVLECAGHMYGVALGSVGSSITTADMTALINAASNYVDSETLLKLRNNDYTQASGRYSRDPNDSYIVGFPAQYTIAEVLGSIAAMYGGNFCISNEGKLKLVGFGDLSDESDLLINEIGDYITFGTGNNKVRIRIYAKHDITIGGQTWKGYIIGQNYQEYQGSSNDLFLWIDYDGPASGVAQYFPEDTYIVDPESGESYYILSLADAEQNGETGGTVVHVFVGEPGMEG